MSTWTQTVVSDGFIPVGKHMVRVSLIESWTQRDDGGVRADGKRATSVVVRTRTGTEYVADGLTEVQFREVIGRVLSPKPSP